MLSGIAHANGVKEDIPYRGIHRQSHDVSDLSNMDED